METDSRETSQKKTGVRTDILIMGVALIIVGAILLFTTLNPSLDFSDMFITYWPALIIMAGLIKILQSLTGQNQSGVMGAFFFMFIILALASGAAWTMFDGSIWFGEWWSHQVYYQSDAVELDGVEAVAIYCTNADIRINAENRDDLELNGTVRSHRKVDDDWRSSMYDKLVRLDKQGSILRIDLDSEAMVLKGTRFVLDLEISIPKGLDVRVKGNKSDVSVYSMVGKLEAELDRGDLYVRHAKGEVIGDVFRGDLTIRDADGPVELSGSYVDLELYNVYSTVRIITDRADIEIDNDYALAGDMTIVNERGAIELEFDQDSNFSFDGLCESGRVYVDFGNEDDSKRGRYQYRHGDGTYLIKVENKRGNISLDY